MKLRLGIKRVDNVVFGRVLWQDESLRREDDSAGVNHYSEPSGFEIRSFERPELGQHRLYIRGAIQSFDNEWFAGAYHNADEAEADVEAIKRGVAAINAQGGPKPIEDYGLEIVE